MDHQQEWELCLKITTDIKLKDFRSKLQSNKNSCSAINILQRYTKYKLQKGLKPKGMILANILEDLKQYPLQDPHQSIEPLIRLDLVIVYTEIIITQNLVNERSYVEKISEHLQHLQDNKPILRLPDVYSLNYKIASMVNLLHKGFKHEANYKINQLAMNKPTINLVNAKKYINKECREAGNFYGARTCRRKIHI